MLGLAYPGGPLVAKLAEQGDPKRFRFPRPMTDRPGLDFSFSGLKTHTLTAIRQLEAADELDDQAKADVARAFEEAVVDTLVIKCRRALDQTGLKRIRALLYRQRRHDCLCRCAALGSRRAG